MTAICQMCAKPLPPERRMYCDRTCAAKAHRLRRMRAEGDEPAPPGHGFAIALFAALGPVAVRLRPADREQVQKLLATRG